MSLRSKLRNPVSSADHSQGPESASLVLVEYGDFECPYCGKAYPVIKRLQETLKDELRFVFRHFPLTSMHPFALDAARAAEAAGLQGKFWEMHDIIYEHQQSLDPESLVAYAATLKLDLAKFDRDLRAPEVDQKIELDLFGGARSGVNGTPSFFINGVKYDGDWSYPWLLNALAAQGLKKAG